jgi:hypothetical protein
VVPIVKKTIVPAVEVKPIPEVHLLKQPVIPPAIFQKQIFALKNPSVRVLTYSDLCTVYPYQRKLSACIHKKAAIPELHHPDIQLVSEDQETKKSNQESPTQINTSASNNRPTSSKAKSSRTAGENIQEILRPKGDRGSILPLNGNVKLAELTSNESEEERSIEDAENINVAPSNNNVKQIKVSNKKTTTAKPTTATTTTTTTTPAPPSVSTTRKPKTKRGSSRNGGSKRSGGRRKNSSTTSTTTTDKPFKLV